MTPIKTDQEQSRNHHAMAKTAKKDRKIPGKTLWKSADRLRKNKVKIQVTPAHTYRFGFVLSTGSGNLTRYLNLRKYAERV